MPVDEKTEALVVAWISVYESVDGPKLRDLAEKLGTPIATAEGILIRLWHWGMNNADKTGHILHADEMYIGAMLFMAMTNSTAENKKAEGEIRNLASKGMISPTDVAEATEIHIRYKRESMIRPDQIADALVESGWIDRTGDDLYLHDWAYWQEKYYKYIDKLERDRNRKRATGSAEDTSDVAKQSIASETDEKPTPERKTVKRKTAAKKEYSKDFERFWEVYPRHEAKADAYECFGVRVKEGFDPNVIVAAAENYAAQCRKERKEPKFTLQAKTFLGPHLRFMDYVSKEPKTAINPDNPFEQFMEE